ncbi:Fe-S cluster assembly protein HesB [Cephaloticoccus primus]|uniref:Adenine DNA glycosylase n=1 Tax=Cephaloticoccus primus TaxID=1548207 RepID=A0A139SS43_9BACT|nr:A/G-specific adenine glycosylase [Cephaloticoccus primus]KXU37363.1 Fe-S cluster assembly protein HesB [Cephaloticoccus primus]
MPDRPDNPQAALIAAAAPFRAALLDWYRRHARVLPWRNAPSLYKTVVSEFMLQQTQVKTVLPYFARWIAALPDFAALAAAPEAQVLKLWEGLGYYSRARNLHKLARALAPLPEPPRRPEEWLSLPGIGPYTAAAITSINFGAHAAVVDGNVVRILARLSADGTPYRDSSTAAKTFAPLASALLNTAAPGDHNQAMMELGATLCLRRKPLCLTCPVRTLCACHSRGLEPENYPRLAPRQIEKLTVARAWCVKNGKLLLHRTPAKSRRLAHLYELPSAEQLGTRAGDFFGTTAKPLLTKKRGITRYQITENIFAAEAPEPLPADLEWIALDELEAITLSGPHRRWVRELLRATP